MYMFYMYIYISKLLRSRKKNLKDKKKKPKIEKKRNGRAIKERKKKKQGGNCRLLESMWRGKIVVASC